MDFNESSPTEKGLQQIQTAQNQLDAIQAKIHSFQQKKHHSHFNSSHTPYPNLSAYFSFLSEEIQDAEPMIVESRRVKAEGNWEEVEKENKSLTLNRKLQMQKQQNLDKLEEYYDEKNALLDFKIVSIRQAQSKVQCDQRLLQRNNHELQKEIHFKQSHPTDNQPRQTLLRRIDQSKKSLKDVHQQNEEIKKRKRELQAHIQECVKNHKMLLRSEVGKGVSHSQCPYH